MMVKGPPLLSSTFPARSVAARGFLRVVYGEIDRFGILQCACLTSPRPDGTTNSDNRAAVAAVKPIP